MFTLARMLSLAREVPSLLSPQLAYRLAPKSYLKTSVQLGHTNPFSPQLATSAS